MSNPFAKFLKEKALDKVGGMVMHKEEYCRRFPKYKFEPTAIFILDLGNFALDYIYPQLVHFYRESPSWDYECGKEYIEDNRSWLEKNWDKQSINLALWDMAEQCLGEKGMREGIKKRQKREKDGKQNRGF